MENVEPMGLGRVSRRVSTPPTGTAQAVESLGFEGALAAPPTYDPPPESWVAAVTAGKAVSGPRSRSGFVIVGCSRSGTTSLCNILDQATNGICVQEPEPNLNVETRMATDGRYPWAGEVIDQTVAARAHAVWERGLVYGEKNVTLGPFVPQLAKLGFRIVVTKRDGREVVQSLINWHDRLFGNIYRECADSGELSARARAAIENLPAGEDRSDYSRPRPVAGNPFHERWSSFSRLEMCAWYWAHICNRLMDAVGKLPASRWRVIDYSRVDAAEIGEIAAFLGLEGLDPDTVRGMLAERINSLRHRTGEAVPIRSWTDWTDDERARFECIAASTMMRLGYYDAETHVRFKPACYGEWWRGRAADVDWYTWMYESRRDAHEDLLAFVRRLKAAGETVDSILDVGCGCGVGYREAFADRRYVGMDLSEKTISWCRDQQSGRQSFISGDIILDQPEEKFDLVFSQGTIDNSYDVNAYLRAMVRVSRGWVYLTAYRGWFPELDEHRYLWDRATTCFYNDVSPIEVERVLRRMGCTQVSVEPLAMGGDALETRIIARAPGA